MAVRFFLKETHVIAWQWHLVWPNRLIPPSCPQQNVQSTLPCAQTAGWIRLSGPWGAVARAANGLQIDPLPEKIVLMLIVTTVDRLAA
jgi:hypothetical protein